MFYPMGSFWSHTMHSLICTHESACHVSQIPMNSLRTIPPWLHHSRMLYWCQLVYLPSHTCTYGSDGSVPSYRCKRFFIIYPFHLGEATCHKYFLLSHDVSIYYMLDLVDPYGRHYKIPFRSRHRILDIIPLDQLVLFDHSLLPFLLGYFFIAGRLCINDLTQ